MCAFLLPHFQQNIFYHLRMSFVVSEHLQRIQKHPK